MSTEPSDEHPPGKVDPDSLALRAPPRAVTRLNRKMLAVAGALLAGAVLTALMWALRPQKPGETKTVERPVTRVPRAEGLANLPTDYTQVPKLGPPLGELGRSIMPLEQQADAPPVPDRMSFEHDAEEDAARAARLAQQADAEAAAKAGVFFKLSERRSEPKTATDMSVAMPSGTELRGAQPKLDDPNGQASKRAFLQPTLAEEGSRAGAEVTSQLTHRIKAGNTIPAALITQVNSDLPGTVTASVTENVYDSDTGAHVLIPQGATLIGRYDSEITFGQSRVLIVWTKLEIDNALPIPLDQLQATDAAGRTGLHDRVDYHWGRLVAGAALSTLIGVGAELASPDRIAKGDDRVIVSARDSIHETTNEVGKEITRRNLNVQPTLQLRHGLPLRVMIHTDLYLPVHRP